MESASRRQQYPGGIQARIRTVVTIGFAIYGVYKLGEWAIDAIRDKKRRNEYDASNVVVGEDILSSNSVKHLDRSTQTKLQKHHRVACVKEALALVERMNPSLRESIQEVTSIASERQALKRLRGEPAERQQEHWEAIQNKTLVRLFLTICAESMLFPIVNLHIHYAAAMQLPSSQSSAIFLTIYDSFVSFVTGDLKTVITDAVIAGMRCTDWNTTTSDAALHMTYAKLKAGMDGCLLNLNSTSELMLFWDPYVQFLDKELGSSEDPSIAELLDLFESPLAKEAVVETFHTLYIQNAMSNVQPIFAERGELPLAQVTAKLSKTVFHLEHDKLVSLATVRRIGQVLFPEGT